MTGECFAGELAGKVLAKHPTGRLTTWSNWIATHPETDVMAPEPEHAKLYFVRHRAWSGTAGFPVGFESTLFDRDPRLELSDLVCGVSTAHGLRAYPIDRMRLHRVVEETQGSTPVTVWFDVRSRSVAAFDSRIEGRPHSFRFHSSGLFDEVTTGSTFNLEGECIAGSLRGVQLTSLRASLVEWYAWFAHHRETIVWKP